MLILRLTFCHKSHILPNTIAKYLWTFGNHLNYPGILIVCNCFRLLAFIVSSHIPFDCRGGEEGLLTKAKNYLKVREQQLETSKSHFLHCLFL